MLLLSNNFVNIFLYKLYLLRVLRKKIGKIVYRFKNLCYNITYMNTFTENHYVEFHI